MSLAIEPVPGKTTIEIDGTPTTEMAPTYTKSLVPVKILASAAADEPVRQDQVFGVPLVTQDVKASRALVTNYVNDKPHPIFVSVTLDGVGVGGTIYRVVGTFQAYGTTTVAGMTLSNISFWVPSGALYHVGASGGSPTIATWTEEW